MVSRSRANCSPPMPSLPKNSPRTLAIQNSQRDLSSLSSHTLHFWLSLSSTRLWMNPRKKPVTSGLADQQVERALHGVALDVRHALRAAALIRLRRERLFKLVQL